MECAYVLDFQILPSFSSPRFTCFESQRTESSHPSQVIKTSMNFLVLNIFHRYKATPRHLSSTSFLKVFHRL